MSKTYLDQSKQIICATKPVFREPLQRAPELVEVNEKELEDAGNKNDRKWRKIKLLANLPDDVECVGDLCGLELERLDAAERRLALANLNRAMRRARVRVRDYCLSTPMAWFVTLTVDPVKADRYNVAEMTKHLNVWLNDMVKREGLAYVMVPELHKDGAIHYHALFTDSVKAVFSGTIIPRGEDKPRRPRSEQQRLQWLASGGREVFNLPQWPYGFTTAIRLTGNYEQAVNYVCKYITKGHNKDRDSVIGKVGGRWFYHGGDLGRPEIEYADCCYADVLEAAGDAAHVIDVSDRLDGVEILILWQRPDGTLRARRR